LLHPAGSAWKIFFSKLLQNNSGNLTRFNLQMLQRSCNALENETVSTFTS